MNMTPADPVVDPAQDDVWTGIVLRPPHASWDGVRYRGDSVVAIDQDSVAGVTGPVRVVHAGDFLAVAAPHPAMAFAAARALKVQWRRATDIVEAAPPLPDGGMERSYAWPADRLVADGLPQAYARWPDADTLEVRADAIEPRRLRRELATLLGLDPANIKVTDGVSLSMRQTPRNGFAVDGHDAAADAALIARAVHRAVRVTALPARAAAALSIRMRTVAANGAPTAAWRMQPATPMNARPPWALLAAGQEVGAGADADSAHVGAVSPPYRIPFDIRPATSGLTADLKVDPRVAELAAVFALESFADEVARESDMDPVQWRLDHLADPRGRALVQEVAARAGWHQDNTASIDGRGALERRAAAQAGGLRQGRGFAYASTADRDADPPLRAWSAWVVDVKVDALAGRIDIGGLTVGHHVEGMERPASADGDLQARIAAATTQLLGGPTAFDDWDGVGATLPPALKVVDLAGEADDRTPTTLSTSLALTLPLAAAIANAIFDATGIRLREPPFDGMALRRAAIETAPSSPALDGPAQRPADGAPSAKRSAPWRRALSRIGAGAAAVAGLAVTALPWRPAIAPAAPDLSVYSEAAIARGRLIAAASDCVVCHTAPGGKENAGGLAMDTPFGTIYSTNITPDPDTGIGKWSFEAFDRAMRHGVSRDGRHLYPAFPYTSFAKFSESDMQALYAYMMTRPAVAAMPPQTKLAFPFNVRPLMAGWNLLFHDATPFTPDASRSTLWNRGAYLVEGAGHCGACHTARNAFGAEKSGPLDYLGGATVEHWDAPALNRLSTAPLPWTRDDLYAYLRTGYSERHGVAAGPMAPVIAGLAALPDHDIMAMAVYLTELPGDTVDTQSPRAMRPATGDDTPLATDMPGAPPMRSALETATAANAATGARTVVTPVVPTPITTSVTTPVTAPHAEDAQLFAMPGRRIYEGACAACHDQGSGMPLFGVQPDLGLNTNLTAARPDNLIQIILHGIDNPANDELGYMPGFASTLNDRQVTDLVHYLRARHGGDAGAWSGVESTVASLRNAVKTGAATEVSP